MGKKKRSRANAAAELEITRGSGKQFKKKGEGNGVLGKVLGIIAAVLAVLIVAGTLLWFYLPSFIQKKLPAIKTEHYEVSTAMLTYFFNSTYQNYVNTYSSYLSYVGLDTTKDLKDQNAQSGGTWYDEFLNSATDSASEILVLNEAARADKKYDKSKEVKKNVDETVAEVKEQAIKYNVSVDYYLKSIYGSLVNEKVFREALTLTENASLYSKELQSRYKISEDDWNEYYDNHLSELRKVDYVTYTFTVDTTNPAEGASEQEIAEANKNNAKALDDAKTLGAALSSTKTKEEFLTFVENYLRNTKYANVDEEALKEQNVDIDALVKGCFKEGMTNSSETELNKWAFDEARVPYETKVEESDTAVTVTMILPAEDSDIGFACMYRDTYTLKSYRTIPFLSETYGDLATAKTAADEIFAQYKDKAKEDTFADLANKQKTNEQDPDGGLIENGDHGAVAEEIDAWLEDAARKEGDCEIVEAGEKGYYLVYYKGEGMVKWQSDANDGCISDRYEKEYDALKKKHKVNVVKKNTAFIKEVDLSKASETTAA